LSSPWRHSMAQPVTQRIPLGMSDVLTAPERGVQRVLDQPDHTHARLQRSAILCAERMKTFACA
jgi:hypothetical protein